MNARRKALISAAIVAVLALYLPFFRALIAVTATNPYAGHVVLVPLFAVVLLWGERHRFRGLIGRGHPSGAAVAALALSILAVGYWTADVQLQALSFVVLMGALGLWSYGLHGLRQAAFVLAFLLLVVPPPPQMIAAAAPTIQYFVAMFSRTVLESLRIPVTQNGVFLHVPGMVLEVAEECAGLRFALILFVFVSAFARLVIPARSAQVALIAASIPVAMLANAWRVAITTAGAYLIGTEVITGPLHFYIGKGFWALALLLMIGLAWRLRSRSISPRAAVRSLARA